MANEWTANDVLRVMREVADPDGLVAIHLVARQFKLQTRQAQEQFARCVATLESAELYFPTNLYRGRVKL
jgi:hypothetical protein